MLLSCHLVSRRIQLKTTFLTYLLAFSVGGSHTNVMKLKEVGREGSLYIPASLGQDESPEDDECGVFAPEAPNLPEDEISEMLKQSGVRCFVVCWIDDFSSCFDVAC